MIVRQLCVAVTRAIDCDCGVRVESAFQIMSWRGLSCKREIRVRVEFEDGNRPLEKSSSCLSRTTRFERGRMFNVNSCENGKGRNQAEENAL